MNKRSNSSVSILERLALFKATLVRQQITAAEAAQQLGVSYNHLQLVLRAERKGSKRLEDAIALLMGLSHSAVFGESTNPENAK